MTQANTASAEESASASEELASQATQVKGMLQRFKLSNASLVEGPAPQEHHEEPVSQATGRSGKRATAKETAMQKVGPAVGNGHSNRDLKPELNAGIDLDDKEFDRF